MDQFLEEIERINQLTNLRIQKMEYEMLALKGFVFKNIADQKGMTTEEVFSKFESVMHVTYLSEFETICATFPLLDPVLIKKHLKLED